MAIIVSLLADDLGTLLAQVPRQASLADLVEVRLDRIGHPGRAGLEELVAASPKPLVVACHGPESGGEFAGGVDARLDLLFEAAEAGARFVDVDWRDSLALGEVKAPCHRIVSRHELDGTPEDLDELLEEVRDVLYEGDVTKLVTAAACCEDGLRLLRWLRTTKGIVSFASGAAGSFTRVLAPIFGSPFTYAAPAEVPGLPTLPATAPGQLRVNDLLARLPPGGVSQETAVLGVVGRPIGHSFSPWVQGMALKAARLDAVYVAFEPRDLAGFLALADDENYRGFSITAPFKEDAFRLVERRDEACERTGAVNTLVRDERGWQAANTDVPAVRDTLEQGLRIHGQQAGRRSELAGAHVAVVGAGGAARAAAWAARSLGARVTLYARDPGRARAAADALEVEAAPLAALGEAPHDVLVHATPVGGAGAAAGELAFPAEALRPDTLVLDAVYHPIRTPLLAAAHARGCTCVPGGEWFCRQAIAQFRLFTQAEPDEELLRKAFEHAHETALAR